MRTVLWLIGGVHVVSARPRTFRYGFRYHPKERLMRGFSLAVPDRSGWISAASSRTAGEDSADSWPGGRRPVRHTITAPRREPTVGWDPLEVE